MPYDANWWSLRECATKDFVAAAARDYIAILQHPRCDRDVDETARLATLAYAVGLHEGVYEMGLASNQRAYTWQNDYVPPPDDDEDA